MTSPPPPHPLPALFTQGLATAIVTNPYCKSLGMELVSTTRERVTLKVPYRTDLAGNADGVIAGGVVTTLLDNVCGAAAGLALTTMAFVATINLRIDYMRAAKPGLDIVADGECYKMTRNVAFVRAIAYEVDRADPIAHCVSAFMLNPIPPDLAALQGMAP